MQTKGRILLVTASYFLLAGLLEVGGGYLVWQWLREDFSWIIGALGGFLLFLYGIVPTLQPSHFHRIYAAYGGFFVVIAIFWGWVFDGTQPDIYDTIGAMIILIGAAVIFYWPRKHGSVWNR